jgi:hypothetical protein
MAFSNGISPFGNIRRGTWDFRSAEIIPRYLSRVPVWNSKNGQITEVYNPAKKVLVGNVLASIPVVLRTCTLCVV